MLDSFTFDCVLEVIPILDENFGGLLVRDRRACFTLRGLGGYIIKNIEIDRNGLFPGWNLLPEYITDTIRLNYMDDIRKAIDRFNRIDRDRRVNSILAEHENLRKRIQQLENDPDFPIFGEQ